MFKPSKAKTPEEYFELIDEPRKSEIKKLDALIRKTIPKLNPEMFGSIIGYGKYRYKSPSGREGDWFPIGLASQKNYISLYICSVKDGKYLPELHKKDLPKASIGKSCIRFKKTEDIDLDLLAKIIKEGASSPMYPA